MVVLPQRSDFSDACCLLGIFTEKRRPLSEKEMAALIVKGIRSLNVTACLSNLILRGYIKRSPQGLLRPTRRCIRAGFISPWEYTTIDPRRTASDDDPWVALEPHELEVYAGALN